MYVPESQIDGLSRTALGINAFCALVTRHPALSEVFYDPFAAPLFRAAAQQGAAILDSVVDWPAVERFSDEVLQQDIRTIAHVVWRKRYMADHVGAALQSGARQIVVLGSGMDTLGLRIGPRAGARVFEVDMPDTIAAKRDLVGKLFGTPPHITYTAVDFSRETFLERLLAEGYDHNAPTVFIAEVSLEYVPTEEVSKTYHMIRSNGSKDSVFLTTYMPKADITDHPERDKVLAKVRAAAEPMLFTPEQDTLPDWAKEHGFRLDDYLDGNRLADEYLTQVGLPEERRPFSSRALRRTPLTFAKLVPA